MPITFLQELFTCVSVSLLNRVELPDKSLESEILLYSLADLTKDISREPMRKVLRVLKETMPVCDCLVSTLPQYHQNVIRRASHDNRAVVSLPTANLLEQTLLKIQADNTDLIAVRKEGPVGASVDPNAVLAERLCATFTRADCVMEADGTLSLPVLINLSMDHVVLNNTGAGRTNVSLSVIRIGSTMAERDSQADNNDAIVRYDGKDNHEGLKAHLGRVVETLSVWKQNARESSYLRPTPLQCSSMEVTLRLFLPGMDDYSDVRVVGDVLNVNDLMAHVAVLMDPINTFGCPWGCGFRRFSAYNNRNKSAEDISRLTGLAAIKGWSHDTMAFEAEKSATTGLPKGDTIGDGNLHFEKTFVGVVLKSGVDAWCRKYPDGPRDREQLLCAVGAAISHIPGGNALHFAVQTVLNGNFAKVEPVNIPKWFREIDTVDGGKTCAFLLVLELLGCSCLGHAVWDEYRARHVLHIREHLLSDYQGKRNAVLGPWLAESNPRFAEALAKAETPAERRQVHAQRAVESAHVVTQANAAGANGNLYKRLVDCVVEELVSISPHTTSRYVHYFATHMVPALERLWRLDADFHDTSMQSAERLNKRDVEDTARAPPAVGRPRRRRAVCDMTTERAKSATVEQWKEKLRDMGASASGKQFDLMVAHAEEQDLQRQYSEAPLKSLIEYFLFRRDSKYRCVSIRLHFLRSRLQDAQEYGEVKREEQRARALQNTKKRQNQIAFNHSLNAS